MRTIAFILFCLISTFVTAQLTQVESKVYSWSHAGMEKKDDRESRQFFEGSARDLEYLEVHATTLMPGAPTKGTTVNTNVEELIIVKEGNVKITINQKSKTIGPGSIAMVMPGDAIDVENTGNTNASYYIMTYRARQPADKTRGTQHGGSFILDFKDIKYKEHERGGTRSYFERPTTMAKRFEMHVTTLNGGIKSHEPHTHRAAEIVLMIEGHTQMQIGEKFYNGTTGDIYYLGSNILHAIQNVGSEPCMYFAFQWD